MSRRMCLVGLAVLMGACSSSVNVEQERTALMQRDRDWSQTTKDVDKFMSFFASDAALYGTGMPVVSGADAIRQAFLGMSAAPGFSLTWTVTKADVSAAGDLGYTTGAYAAAMGGPAEKGKYVTVWTKQAGAWMVKEDIFNADGPPPAPPHAMVAPGDIKWGDPPPGLPAGGRFAVVAGDPSQAAPFVLRVQVPAGYKIALHWHPTSENLTVLSGTIALGTDKADAPMKDVAAGGLVVMPAEMRHTFLAKTASTFQVHGTGPFAINYVNAADDPRTKK